MRHCHSQDFANLATTMRNKLWYYVLKLCLISSLARFASGLPLLVLLLDLVHLFAQVLDLRVVVVKNLSSVLVKHAPVYVQAIEHLTFFVFSITCSSSPPFSPVT